MKSPSPLPSQGEGGQWCTAPPPMTPPTPIITNKNDDVDDDNTGGKSPGHRTQPTQIKRPHQIKMGRATGTLSHEGLMACVKYNPFITTTSDRAEWDTEEESTQISNALSLQYIRITESSLSPWNHIIKSMTTNDQRSHAKVLQKNSRPSPHPRGLSPIPGLRPEGILVLLLL